MVRYHRYKALQSQTRLARRGRIQLFQLSWMSLRVRLAPNVRNTAKNGQRDSDPIPQWEMSLRMILRTPYISYVIYLYMYTRSPSKLGERGNSKGQFRLCSGNRTQSEFYSAPQGRPSLTLTIRTDSTVPFHVTYGISSTGVY